MGGQSPFTGTPLGYADTINGAGIALSGVDCGTGVRAGTKCFVATGLQYWTLTVSAAVVDHVSVEAALNFPAMRWLLDGTPGTGTVTSVASADGSVVITNPTTTPDLSVRMVSPADLTALSALVTVGKFQDGQLALVKDTGLHGISRMYVLNTTAVAADGYYNVATSDNAAKKWRTLDADAPAPEIFITDALDLTAIQSNIRLIPARTGFFPVMVSRNWIIETVVGTLTTGPTSRAGNDAGHVNFAASTANTPPAAGVNTFTAPFTSAANGFPSAGTTQIPGTDVLMDITLGAVGVGLTLTARFGVGVNWFKAP